MAPNKALVFISHIAEQTKLATIIREALIRDFLNMVEVFVASDSGSLKAGQPWMERIADALARANVVLVLCSKASVQRPWLSFEAGAAYVREIPVIPVCHTDLAPRDLPPPFLWLHGVRADDPSGIEAMYKTIADAVGSSVPAGGFERLAEQLAQAVEARSIEVPGAQERPFETLRAEDTEPGFLDTLVEGHEAIQKVTSLLRDYNEDMTRFNEFAEAQQTALSGIQEKQPPGYLQSAYGIAEAWAAQVRDLAVKYDSRNPEYADCVAKANAALSLIANIAREQELPPDDEGLQSFLSVLSGFCDQARSFFSSMSRLKIAVQNAAGISRSMRTASRRFVSSLDTLVTHSQSLYDTAISAKELLS